ncbi:MAG: chromosome segregation protein SMC [Eubacteriales bacterium]|nr:chromosome segregation protein SMC [Eubacteriales bacterium]
MYLAKVTMQGFKSFPDRTSIDFHPGITAIVGPNGSGKSNVMEAVRWVLGEQSAKSLRGDRMEDVIFNGTQSRRRMGYAEVSILFEEASELTGGDSALEITRRYYRNGDSEYLLNRQVVRLKDITELFADTGVGKRGYSIISQGKVDELLSEQSSERRKIFDEAAGIVKFKLRRKEALRRLVESSDNLIRSEDAIAILEERYAPLEKAAKRLRDFRKKEARARELDLALTINEEAKNAKRSESLLESIAILKNDQSNLAEKIQATVKRAADFKAEREQLELENESLRKAQIECQAQQANLREEQARAETQRQFYARESERLLSEAESIANEVKETELILNELQASAELNQGQAAAEKTAESLAEAEAAVLSARSKEESLETAEHESSEIIKNYASEILKLREEELKLSSHLADLKRRKEEIAAEESERLKEVQKLEQAKRDFEKEASEVKNEVLELKDSISSQEQAVADLKTEITKLREAAVEHRMKSEEAQMKVNLLQSAEEDLVGYHQSYRRLMAAADQDSDLLKGLIGPFGRLIEVEEKYEKAVERALGPALHFLVCAKKTDAERLINWLKKHRAGRETFLPLDHYQAKSCLELEGRYQSAPGCLGILSKYVQVDPKYQALLDDFLGRIILVDKMQSAFSLQELGQRRAKIVTLAGELLYPSGSVTGGEESGRSLDLLARRRELKLALELSSSEEQLALETLDRLKATQTKAEALTRQLDLNLHSQRELARRELQVGGQLEQLEARLESLSQVAEDQDTEAEKSLVKQVQEISQSIRELHQHREAELSKQSQLILELKTARESTAEAVQDLQRLSFAREQEAREAELREKRVEDQAKRLRELAEKREQKLDEAAVLKERQESLLAEEVKRAEQLAELQLRSDDEEEAFLKLEAQRKALFTAQEAEYSKAEQVREDLNRLNLELAKQENELGRLAQKAVDEKNRLWEQYELSWQQAIAAAGTLDLSQSKARQELQELRRELRALGPIQSDADQEFKELEERLSFLHEQRADIVRSKKDVETLIERLDREMKEQFLTEFEKLQAAFKSVFTELFQGGRADLVLTDPDDLDSAIEIKAQPPGKRLQSLSLLSGGERALTAIAVLFALFKLRPAPFAFLDEVESALDESNIDRFTAYLDRYTDETQFILITHRKGTMVAAERLYGISMKERGVSELLALELECVERKI